MASPLQRLHRSRRLPLSRGALLGFSSFEIRLDDLAPHRFGAREGSAIGRVFGRASALLRGFSHRASRLDLSELSPSAHHLRTAGTHPTSRVSPRRSPMCTAASHGVLRPIAAHLTTLRLRCSRSLPRVRCPALDLHCYLPAFALWQPTQCPPCSLHPSNRVLASPPRLFRVCPRQARRTHFRLLPRAWRCLLTEDTAAPRSVHAPTSRSARPSLLRFIRVFGTPRVGPEGPGPFRWMPRSRRPSLPPRRSRERPSMEPKSASTAFCEGR